MDRSIEEFDRLLPEGIETPEQYLLAIMSDDGSEVGAVWYRVRPTSRGPSGLIWWLETFEAFRRKGYAEATLVELERHAADKGVV